MKLQPEVLADLYQALKDDSVAFERYSDMRVNDFIRAMETARILTAREIHEFIDQIENTSEAGFDQPFGSWGPFKETTLSKFYIKIGRFQAIFNPSIRYAEEVECFHQVCFDMGLSMILLPEDPKLPIFRVNPYQPTIGLPAYLGILPVQTQSSYVIPAPTNQNGWGAPIPTTGNYGTPGTTNTGLGAEPSSFTGIQIFNDLVKRLRSRIASRDYKTALYARDHQTSDLKESCSALLDSMLEKKVNQFRVFSIDFSYRFADRDFVDLARVRKETAKLLAHKKLSGRLGYVRRMQFGLARRHHFHMKLFFEADSRSYEQQLNEIKLAWENDVTGGKGLAYDCRDSECQLKRAAGDFEPASSSARDDLLSSLDYLCYAEILASVDNFPGRVRPIVTGGGAGAKRKG